MFHHLINKIKAQFQAPPPLSAWYFVAFDDTHIHVRANPPKQQGFAYSFLWQDIHRVCFQDGGLSASDCLYIWVQGQEDSYMIPIEASGGDELFLALNQRGLFPDDLMRQAAASTDGGLYCYPALNHVSHQQDTTESPVNIKVNIAFYTFYAVTILCAFWHMPVDWTWWKIAYAAAIVWAFYFAPISWHQGRRSDAIVVLTLIWSLLASLL